MMRALAFLFLSCLVAFGQPAPLLRNAWSTNVAGTTVRSDNNLQVTNLSGGLTHTQWNFHGIGPNTIARLTDVTQIVNTASGMATNAVSVIESNGVVVSVGTTNLNFVDNPTAKVLMTNNPSGHIHLSFTNVIGATTADLLAASNFLQSIVGETNWLGNAGITNSTRIGLADGKSNNTNLVKTLEAGRGIALTNEVGGTNVRIANTYIPSIRTNSALIGTFESVTPLWHFVSGSGLLVEGFILASTLQLTYLVDWTQVASQTNLNTASNFLFGAAIDWNGNAGTTNATRIGLADGRSDNTNLIKTLEAGYGIVLTNEVGGTNVRVAVDPLTTGPDVRTNTASVASPSPIITFTNGSGILVIGSVVIGPSAKIEYLIDWSQVASKTNIAFVTNGFIRLTPQSWLPNTNAPPGLDQGTNQTWRMLFDDTALERVNYQFTLPPDYYTNATLQITYSTLAAAANQSNVWRLACMITKPETATVNADNYNGAVFLTNKVPSTAGFIQNTNISCNLTSAVAGDFIKLLLQREGTNTFDNNSGDTAIHDMMFRYEKKVQ